MCNIMLTKIFNNIIKHHKVQVNKYWGLNAIICKMNSTDANAIDMSILSPEEKDKILNVVNHESLENLLQYSITKKRAHKLESHRLDNGLYNSLEDLLLIKGMNDKCLIKFYKSIISGKSRKAPRKITSGLVTTPRVSDDNQKDVNTILGIYVGRDMISWSLLNRDCEVLQWHFEVFPHNHLKENLHSLLQSTLPIAAKFPKADRYIMQEFGGDTVRRSPKLYQVCMEQSVINAIILSHLATLNSKFDTVEFVTNNIFILRQNILRKIYGLVVGNESISTQYILQKLLEENNEPPESKERAPTVYLKPEFRNMYNMQNSTNKEQISWSLLIALAFIELIVHERTDMRIRNSV